MLLKLLMLLQLQLSILQKLHLSMLLQLQLSMLLQLQLSMLLQFVIKVAELTDLFGFIKEILKTLFLKVELD